MQFSKGTLLIFCVTISLFLYGCGSSFNIPEPVKKAKQSSVDEENKISEAVELHDKGEYDKAINIYQDILKDNPDNMSALYELSISTFKKNDFQRSLDYALRGLEYDSELLSNFYLQAANNLDLLGKPKEAIKVYKEAIEKFPNSYMLNFNLGVTYNNLKKYNEAGECYINAIKLNKFHAGSHINLAGIYINQGKQVPSLLLLLRFLAIEPNTKRSETAVAMVDELLSWGVQRKDDKNVTINLFDIDENNPYSSMEMVLKLARAVSFSSEKGETIIDKRVKEISSVLNMISEKKDKKYTDFTADYLFPYFGKMVESKNSEAFIYYIYQSVDNDEVDLWLYNNTEKLDSLADWEAKYKW